MSVLVVIPARYASERLPGKALLRESGRSLVQHVWERVREARRAPRIVIATDDPRILAEAERFGAEALLTSPTHPSGTDRVAEVARMVEAGIVVNWQGDEPELPGAACDALVAAFDDPRVPMATLAAPCDDPEAFAAPSVVKVVCDAAGDALYFSRAPIPHPRTRGGGAATPLQHVGIYAFRRETLLRLAALPPAPLERAEGLEQLRALTHGIRIRVVVTPHVGRGIDTRPDYDRFLARVRAGGPA